MVILLFVLLFFAQANAVFGKITDAEVSFDDRLLVPLDEPYGTYPRLEPHPSVSL